MEPTHTSSKGAFLSKSTSMWWQDTLNMDFHGKI